MLPKHPMLDQNQRIWIRMIQINFIKHSKKPEWISINLNLTLVLIKVRIEPEVGLNLVNWKIKL